MNNIYSCCVTHIEIVGRLIKVWVHHSSKTVKDLQEAIASVKNILEYSEALASLDQVSSRVTYLAKYSDNQFYRCTVQGGSCSNKINVSFIDYGNSHVVTLNDVRMLTPDLKSRIPILSCPGQATSYYLHDFAIKPGAMTDRMFEWLKALTLNTDFKCYLYEGIKGITTISILLDTLELSNLLVQKDLGQRITKEELCSLAQELTSYSGVAPYPTGSMNQTVHYPHNPQMPTKIEVVAQNVASRKPSMPLYQPPGVFQHQHQHIINQQQINSVQQQRFVTREKPVNLPSFPFQSDVTKMFDNTITLGSHYHMYVSHVEDGPLLFFLQIKQYADEVLPYLRREMSQLSLKNFTSALTIGTWVIGQHQPDKTLRRGMVVSACASSCKVYYVDIGSSESLQFSNIFQLPENLRMNHIPDVAINFALNGIKPGQVKEPMKAKFQELVMSKVVLAKFLSDTPVRTCDLFVEGRDVKILLANFSQPLQYLRQFPPREKETGVVVSYVEGPHQIFVQYKCELTVLSSIESTLASKWMQMNEITSANDLSIGKPVLSLYSSDNQWYRAQVMEISPNQTITVFYVDYGNKEYVNAITLREISSELVSKWRCQSVECCLVGFENVVPSEALAEKLEAKILSSEFTLRLHSLLTADRLLVDLLDPCGNSIAAYMTELLKDHNAEIKNQNVSISTPEVSSSNFRDLSVQSISTDVKTNKDLDYNDKKSKKDDCNQMWKSKDTLDGQSASIQFKVKDHDDGATSSKWKSREHDEPLPSGKWKAKEYDEPASNKWKPKEFEDSTNAKENDFAYGGKSKPKDRDEKWKKDSDDSLSGKWKSRDGTGYDKKRGENSEGYNKKFQSRDEGSKWKEDNPKWKNNRNDRDDGRSPKWNNEERFQVDGKKDWRFRNNDSKFKDSDYKQRDSDYRSRDTDYKQRYSDYKPRDSDYKPRDSDYKPRDSDYKQRDSDYKQRDSDYKQRDSDYKPRDSGYKPRDSNYKPRDSDYKQRDSDYKQRDSDYKQRDSDFKQRDSGNRKWDDEGRKGRGEFKWKDTKFAEDYNSKRTSKTLYSDSPDKVSSNNIQTTKDSEPAVNADYKFNPKVKEYIGWDMKGRTSCRVTLAHIDSPERFFVRPVEADDEVDKLRDLIDSDTNATSRVLPPKAVVVSTPVLAVYSEDDLLYRAVIEKVNSKTVDVLFVDYGNSSEVPSNELYYPSDNLARLPMTVIRCNLSNVKPHGSWTSDVDALTESFGDKSQLDMTMESVKLVDGLPVHNVSLTVCDSGKSVAQCLVDAGLAKSTSSKGSSPSLQTQESVEPISALPLPLAQEPTASEEEWLERVELLVGQFLLSKVVSIVSAETIIVKLDATNLLVVCVSSDTSSVQIGDTVIIHVNCFLEDRIRVTIYDKGGYVAGDSKKELPQVSPVCQMPISRSCFRVQVPHCESSSVYVQKTSDSERISEMLDSLYAFYQETKSSGKEFAVNSLCAVKSSDENWYRARVISKSGDNYKIRFIDYGNTEDVDGSQIRKLDSQFYYPEFAVKAHINLKWKVPENEIDLMKFVKGKEWTASLLKHNIEDWFISLQDDGGKKLFDELIQCGMAESYRENPFYEVNSVIGNDILAGNKIPVTVTHVDSPNTFWVQMIKHVQTVENLQDKLQDFSDGKKDFNCAVFAAKYSEDKLWYRALNIDAINPGLVRFIDYGNTDTVTERKDLSHTLTKPRSGYAVKMCLCAIPTEGNGWSQEALNLFDKFIDANQISAEIVSVSYKIITDLTVDGKSISNVLVEKGLAVYEDFTPPIIKNYLSIKECQVSSVFVCHTVSVNDFYTLDKNKEPDLEEFTVKLIESDLLKPFEPIESIEVGNLVIAKFPEDESWYRAKVTALDPLTVIFIDFGNSSVVDEVSRLPVEFKEVPPFAVHCSLDLVESDLVLDKFLELSEEGKNVFNMSLIVKGEPNLVKLSLNDTDVCDLLPKVQNDIVNVDGKVAFVSHFNDFEDFYVQLKDDSKLDNVVDELSAAETFGDVDKISIGSLVAALFPEDCLWYRAKVTALDPLTVLFYDFGNTSCVSHVKELPPDLKLIPALAYRCTYDKPSFIDNWTESLIDKFLDISQDGMTPFTVKLVKGGNPNIVTLLNENNQEVFSDMRSGDQNKPSSGSVTQSNPSEPSSGGAELKNTKVSNSGKSTGLFVSGISNKYVTISHFESVDDFHVVCDEDSPLLDKINEKLSDVSSLEDDPELSVDLVVAAQCPETEEYRRARVLTLDPVRVYFIDNGMMCNVHVTKRIPEGIDVSKIKPLAIHCSLKKPMNCTEWPDTVGLLTDYMALSNDKLKIRVHAKEDLYIVSLYLNDKNITSKMGTTYIKTPSFSFQTPSLYNNKLVFICHANSISDFYVQKDVDTGKLEEMSKRLLESVTPLPVESLDIGDLIAAKFPDDGLWYRALVSTVEPQITVKFIDYGNSSVVTEIKDIPDEVKDALPLCLHCSLELLRGLESWTPEAQDKFMTLSANSETFYALRAVSPGDPCSVNLLTSDDELSKMIAGSSVPTDLEEQQPVSNLIKPNPKRSVYKNFSEDSDSELNNMNNRLAILSHVNSLDDFYVQLLDDADKITEIIEKLLDGDSFEDVVDDSEDVMIAAQFSDMQWHRAKILKKIDEGYNVFFVDYGNMSDVVNIKELPPELKEIPSLAYKLTLKKPEGVAEWTEEMEKQFALFKDVNSLPVVVLTHPTGCVSLMINDINIYNKFTNLSLEGFGENMAFITYCESPSNFYIQYNSSFDSQQQILDLLAEAETFEDMENMKEDDLVCAKYPDDEMWYRSKVLKTSPDLCVLFIDFGCTAVVTEVKALTKELKAILPLTKQCCLNPPRCGAGWTPEACSYFLAMSSSAFTVNVIEEKEDGLTTVDLFIDGNSVTSDLLELCPVIERLPDSFLFEDADIDMDLDEEDVMREEALFNAEESLRLNESNNGNNRSNVICNGISDLSLDDKDKMVSIENNRNLENSNMRIDNIVEETPPTTDNAEVTTEATSNDENRDENADKSDSTISNVDVDNKTEENLNSDTGNTDCDKNEKESPPDDSKEDSEETTATTSTDKDVDKPETEPETQPSEPDIPSSDPEAPLDEKPSPGPVSGGDIPSEPQSPKIQTEDKILPGAVQGNLSQENE